jgi:predicted acetyltransferase
MSTFEQDLGDGLSLRFATPDDTEPLAQFNGGLHGDDGQFNPFVAQWTREFMSPLHPTCGPSHVTVVEDTRAGKIVSSMNLIPQTWTYDGIPFGVGRPEAVGTDPAYRRRGLVRAQFNVLHDLSDSEGHLAQGITGIPYYYRQFGYEYAIDLSGGRSVYPSLVPALKAGETEPYRLRPVTLDDIPFIMPLYDRQCARSLIACPCSEAEWRWNLDVDPNAVRHSQLYVIETDGDGRPIGYVTIVFELWRGQFQITELNVIEHHPIREVQPSILRWVKPIAEATANEQHKELKALHFRLGQSHPLFDAAPESFHKVHPPYAWYMRVMDIVAFLRRITPVLEQRLAESSLAGYSGELRVNEVVRGFKMKIERGRIEVEAWTPDDSDNAMFPPYTFLQLLFGRRSLSDLRYAYADCLLEDEPAMVLETLFPKRASNVLPLG